MSIHQKLICMTLLCLAVAAPALAQRKVLALISGQEVKKTHSKFFKGLRDLGYDLDIKQASDSSIKLKEYDTYLYDHLILFSPKTSAFGGGLSHQGILEFVDSGRNVLLAASPALSETMRTLASDCGVDFDDKGTQTFDHFSNSGDHSMVVTSNMVASPAIVGTKVNAPVLFKGLAHSVPGDAELVTVALSGNPTTYSVDPKKSISDSHVAGTATALVSLLQARNNARVLITGSMELFSDELFDMAFTDSTTGRKYSRSGNEAFALAVATWTFQGSGVLRASNLRHHHVGSDEVPNHYRINDDVEFLIDIMEHSLDGAKPYNAKDLQVEFTMLDPHVREHLTHAGNGTYALRFKVPDVYGVFKYVLDYKHLGYSYINLQHVVPVRPFKHNEYERFLLAAYPYYASTLSTMAAFFVFGFAFLYHK